MMEISSGRIVYGRSAQGLCPYRKKNVFLFYIGFHIERKTHFFYIFMERIKKTHFFLYICTYHLYKRTKRNVSNPGITTKTRD